MTKKQLISMCIIVIIIIIFIVILNKNENDSSKTSENIYYNDIKNVSVYEQTEVYIDEEGFDPTFSK